MYLSMLVDDNFVHSDLHPGNLMVTLPSPSPSSSSSSSSQTESPSSRAQTSTDSASDADAEAKLCASLAHMGVSSPLPPDLGFIVLDSGLVTTLTPRNRRNFLSLFGALIMRDGRLAARLMLDNAPAQRCPSPEALQEDMHEVVGCIPLEAIGSVDLGILLSEVMDVVRRHRVKLESDFASLVISLAVIEGIGRQLDPNLSLFQQAVPVLLRNREARTILVQTAGFKPCAELLWMTVKDQMQEKIDRWLKR